MAVFPRNAKEMQAKVLRGDETTYFGASKCWRHSEARRRGSARRAMPSCAHGPAGARAAYGASTGFVAPAPLRPRAAPTALAREDVCGGALRGRPLGRSGARAAGRSVGRSGGLPLGRSEAAWEAGRSSLSLSLALATQSPRMDARFVQEGSARKTSSEWAARASARLA